MRPGNLHLDRWTDRRTIGADPAQTRAQFAGIVDLEGGGTWFPTLGGGLPENGRTGAAS